MWVYFNIFDLICLEPTKISLAEKELAVRGSWGGISQAENVLKQKCIWCDWGRERKIWLENSEWGRVVYEMRLETDSFQIVKVLCRVKEMENAASQHTLFFFFFWFSVVGVNMCVWALLSFFTRICVWEVVKQGMKDISCFLMCSGCSST